MKYFFANWKMYLSVQESIDLAQACVSVEYPQDALTIALFPTALAYPHVSHVTRESTLALGAQNVAWVPKGAYTGAVSAEMYAEIGAQYALVGHSERRHIFGETNDAVKKKFDACLAVGITPVLCIGETQEDLDAGKRMYRLKKQLLSVLEGVSANVSFVVAYEPVWSIGTGNACDHLQAAEIHDSIKNELHTYTDQDIPVLYGGSVNSQNVVSYVMHESIDGVLVGSASVDADGFATIVNAMIAA